jgi:fructosamine-3-kinase
MRPERLTMEDHRFLFRCRQNLCALFDDFDDPCVLVHGNLSLSNMLKEAWSDQLLSMINPGRTLWAPREYELFRLSEEGPAEALLFRYLQQAPVAEGFIARRWLYMLWEEADRLIHTGRFNRARFDLAARSLLPWLE